jgi:hypothetical protein
MDSIDLDQLLDGRNIKQVGAIFLQYAANNLNEGNFNSMLNKVFKIVDDKKPPVFKLNKKEVDLRKAIPLTVKDWKALKAAGVDLLKISQGEVEMEQLIELVSYVCRKANSELTDEDFDTMPGQWFISISKAVNELGGEVDVPF